MIASLRPRPLLANVAVRVLRESSQTDPAIDIERSRMLLAAIAAGESEPLLRLFAPGRALAFGRLDVLRDGYEDARERARAAGFAPIVRLVGGRAAAFTPRCLIYEEFSRTTALTSGTQARFAAVADRIATALRALGADARVGELAGEYCPGRYSVSVAGTTKVAGLGQRAVRGAALVSAVIVVGDGGPIRAVLADVLDALGDDWDPATAGALDDHLPGADIGAVADALLALVPGIAGDSGALR